MNNQTPDYTSVLNSILEVSQAAIVSTNLEGKIKSWNVGAENIYGYTAQEALGQNIGFISSDKDTKSDLEHFLKGQQEVTQAFEKRIRKDNSTVWLSLVFSPIKDVTGNMIGVVEIGQNVSSLKTENEQLHLALDHFPIGTIMVNTQGQIVSVNKKGAELFGYQTQELLGKYIETLIPERFREKHPTYRKFFLEHPIPRPMGVGRDLYGLRKNGKEFPVEIGLMPVQTSNGMFIIAAVVDITERKRNEMLRRSNIELEQFAYVVSHDIKAPLRHITSYIQLLETKYADSQDAETKKWMNFIVHACDKMNSLIADLLKYSRVTMNQLKIEPVNINEVIKDVVEILKEPIQTTKAQITSDSLPTISCSRLYIEQVFLNLLENAIYFSKNGTPPKIHISSIKNREDETEFVVTDNGIGIAPQHFERIFQVFQRLEVKAGVPGTGIGLAIVKKIVELHGGQVWVESQEGEGSAFHFTIKQ